MIYIKKILKKVIKVNLISIFVIILIISGIYLYAFLTPTIPLKSNGKFYIYDSSNNLAYQGSNSSEWVNIEDINDNMLNAIVSTEDKNFYNHVGFDYPRIIAAIFKNISKKRVVEGASTISQQYIKNMYLSFDKTWSRKFEEALLTLEMEMHYSKKEILEGYLNTINFGEGNYGVSSASHYYFDKDAKDLNLEEACILAGIPKSPSNYNPVSNYDRSIKRAKLVANNLYKNGYISKNKYKKLFKKDIPIYGKREKNNLTTLMYYQDAVLSELKNIKTIPNSLIKTGGIKIFTEFDLSIQENLEKAINNNMQDDNMQVAGLYIDPSNGAIRALIGGKNYNKSEYNRVTKAKRQVGSTIKPFLYYTALENGLTSSSLFESAPTTFNLKDGKTYSPSNNNNKYANKNITMEAALAYSDNIYAVKTNLFLGEEKLVDTMKNTGLKEKLDPIPSLALGTKEINMLDYATSYNTLASGGYLKKIHLISKIEDMNGNLLYQCNSSSNKVLNSDKVFIINEMMSNSYNSDFIDYNVPTALSIKGSLSKKYAIKTGTTDRDHWIVGFNPDALLMVWTGSDNDKDNSYGYSKITKNIWAEAIEKSLKDKDEHWYEPSKNIIGIPLNPVTGEYNSEKKVMYYFEKGTEPDINIEPSKNRENS